EIDRRLVELAGWQRDGNRIRRTFELPSFPAAIAFVNRVAGLAEEANHHPDIEIRHRAVTLVLSTHSAGGLTATDLDVAGKIDRLPS
ncbi:MAG: 4a-hydroxytetrahydrobiopterin dehydratase, partial [Longimicrobiales bacterium]